MVLVELWNRAWDRKARVRRTLLAVALILSMWVGIRYADEIFVYITPILLWAYAIMLSFAVLYSNEKIELPKIKFSKAWIGMFALLTIAFGLRMLALYRLPSGFLPDEAGAVDFSIIHIFNPENYNLTINPLRSGTDAQPVLYSYILHWSMDLFGYTTAGARMSSVIIGTFSIAAIFFMMDEMVGRKAAWLAAILMAVYHYHIHWSRIALSNIWVTLLIPLALGFFHRGWRLNRKNEALLSGLCLGFSAYFYTGGYILMFLFPILIWQLWRKTEDYVGLAIYTGKALTFATVIAMPLVIFAFFYPSLFFERVHTIYGWGPDAVAYTLDTSSSWWDYFVYQLTHSFGGYNFYIDVTGFYGASFPFLTDVSSILFLLGIVLAIHKKQYFPVFWILLVTIFGGVMVIGTPASSHFIGAIPAICWLIALPLQWLIEKERPQFAYILLAIIIAMNLILYFYVYAFDPSLDFSINFPFSGQ